MLNPCLIRAHRNRIGIAVAIGLIALSLPNGGYYPRATAVAGLVAWWMVLVGFAGGVLPRARLGRSAIALVAALAGLTLWMAASLIWSDDIGRGVVDVVRASGYVGLALLAVSTARAGEARQWLGGIAIGATTVTAIGLISRYFPSLFDTGRAELAAGFTSALGRLSFPLGYWNAFAGMAALSLVLLIAFAATGRDRRWRAALAGLLPLPMLAIFLSSSRGGTLSAVVGVVVLLVLVRNRERWIALALPGAVVGAALIFIAKGSEAFTGELGGSSASSQGRWMLLVSLLAVLIAGGGAYLAESMVRGSRLPSASVRRAAATVVVLVVAGLLVVLPGRLDSLKAPPDQTQLDGTGHLLSDSSSGRWQYWSTAFHALEEQPLRGIGAGDYPSFWDKNGALPAPILNAHSLPLETLAELGLVGGLLLLVVAVAPLLACLRRLRSAGSPQASLAMAVALAAYAALAVQALVDWIWQVPAVFAIAIAIGAVMAGPAGEEAEEVVEDGRGGGREPAPATVGGRWLRIAAAGAAVIAIAAGGVQLFAQTKIDSATAALDSGDPALARSEAQAAASIEPFSSVPRLEEALGFRAVGRYDEAKVAIDEAITRAPEDWTLRLVSVWIDRARGRQAAANEQMEQMLHLNPQIPSTADGG